MRAVRVSVCVCVCEAKEWVNRSNASDLDDDETLVTRQSRSSLVFLMELTDDILGHDTGKLHQCRQKNVCC